MKEQWVMTLRSIQHEGGERNESVLDTEIRYFDQDGERVIAYEESETTGMEGSQMQLRVAPGDMVSIIRTGTYQTHLVVQPGKKHFCHYETPFGEFAVGVCARWIRNTLSDEGGRLEMRYTVDANSTLLSDNEIRIHVKKCRIGGEA
ncbi:MAG: DUF1934 domain-containing protein [Oscillospiraceae bacterium]|nr:DUF1934 domain-containing protein [Oscillospiraceae bacterium]